MAEKQYKIYEGFRNRLASKYADMTMHINNINAIEKIINLDYMRAVLFMNYIIEYWYAYTSDIINGHYKHINMTSIVWNSFLDHMAR